MAIRLIRIDDRLIHGQVTVGWVPALQVDHIVLLNDRVARVEWEAELYEQAAPPGIEVTVRSVEDGAPLVSPGAFPGASVLVLVESPSDLLRLLRKGADLQEVNVGGLRPGEGTRKILDDLHLDAENESAIRKLLRSNVTLYAQAMPGGRRTDLASVFET